jgi:hypothetical protein
MLEGQAASASTKCTFSSQAIDRFLDGNKGPLAEKVVYRVSNFRHLTTVG